MSVIAMNVKYSYNIANERAARLPFLRYFFKTMNVSDYGR